MNAIATAVVVLALGTLAMEAWLTRRFLRLLAAERDQVPVAVRHEVTLPAHRKAVDYARARLRLGFAGFAWQVALIGLWLALGGLDTLAGIVERLPAGPVLQGAGLVVLFLIAQQCLALPLDAWSVFVVERRFGFNRMGPARFASDQLKQALLTALLGYPVAAAVLWLMVEGPDAWWLWAWLVWTGFVALLIWAFPVWIAPMFNRFTPLEDDALREDIERLLVRSGLGRAPVFVMDGSTRSTHGNAFVSGWGRARRIVLFDTLLGRLEADEILAVLAHEIGHVRKRHLRRRLVAASALSFAGFAVLGLAASHQAGILSALGLAHASPGMLLATMLLLAPLAGYWSSPWIHALSRRHEFEADDFAVRLQGAEPLARALVRLARDNAVPMVADAWYSLWHDSHPPMPLRLERLSGNNQAA